MNTGHKVDSDWCAVFTYRLLYSWNEPPSSSRIFANRTAFKNGTSTNSSKFSSTENLYFFFFIMNAIPGAPGPINVIHATFKPTINSRNLFNLRRIYVSDYCLTFFLGISNLIFFRIFCFHYVQRLVWFECHSVCWMYIYEELYIFMFNLNSLNVVNWCNCSLSICIHAMRSKLFREMHQMPMNWCASARHSICTKARCVRRQHSCK